MSNHCDAGPNYLRVTNTGTSASTRIAWTHPGGTLDCILGIDCRRNSGGPVVATFETLAEFNVFAVYAPADAAHVYRSLHAAYPDLPLDELPEALPLAGWVHAVAEDTPEFSGIALLDPDGLPLHWVAITRLHLFLGQPMATLAYRLWRQRDDASSAPLQQQAAELYALATGAYVYPALHGRAAQPPSWEEAEGKS